METIFNSSGKEEGLNQSNGNGERGQHFRDQGKLLMVDWIQEARAKDNSEVCIWG